MFALGGDAFPNDTQSLRAALAMAAERHGAAGDAVAIEGAFPSLDALRMNLTGVRLDSWKHVTAASEETAGGFFTRTLEVTAEPATFASVPIHIRLHAEDCVFAFGGAADGSRTLMLRNCVRGTLHLSAATADIESALLALAREAAAAHGAEVKSVQLKLTSEGPQQLAASAVAVAKAMFFTATLTIGGKVKLDSDFTLRLSGTTCTGDGMLANLAAAQLRPRLSKIEERTFSAASFLPAGLRPTEIALAGGDSLQIRAKLMGDSGEIKSL